MGKPPQGKAPRIKAPRCPTCRKTMRLESATPDKKYRNLQHVIYVCDCGRTSDQLVADRD